MRHGNSQHVGAFVVTASPIFFYITTDDRCTWKYKMCPSTFSPCSATWRKVGTWEPSSPATMYITLLFAELSATLQRHRQKLAAAPWTSRRSQPAHQDATDAATLPSSPPLHLPRRRPVPQAGEPPKRQRLRRPSRHRRIPRLR